MEEENVQAVTADENGTPEVSADDYVGALGLDDESPEREEPQKEEPKKEEPKAEVKETKPPEEKPKRKIKWQGQDVEIEPEKETEYIQKGFDYTKKTQELATERELLTPYIGVVKAMQSDPVLQKKVAEHLAGGTKEEVKQFDDPIDELRHNIRQDVLRDVESKYIQPVQQRQQLAERQMVINNLKAQVQQDPDFPKVQEAIIGYIKELPEAVGRNLYLQLDQDPQSYMETYKQFKARIAKATPEKPLPTPVKKEEHAPILESANTAPSESENKKMEASIKDLTRKYKATGDNHVLAELIAKGGMLKGVI